MKLRTRPHLDEGVGADEAADGGVVGVAAWMPTPQCVLASLRALAPPSRGPGYPGPLSQNRTCGPHIRLFGSSCGPERDEVSSAAVGRGFPVTSSFDGWVGSQFNHGLGLSRFC